MDTDDSHDSRVKEGRGPSFIPLCYFHLLMNIQTFICNFVHEMTVTHFNRTACIYQTTTQWDYAHYRITFWLVDVTRIDYYPCITSEPTNQMY